MPGNSRWAKSFFFGQARLGLASKGKGAARGSGFAIPDFTDHHDIGILPEDGAESHGKGQAAALSAAGGPGGDGQ